MGSLLATQSATSPELAACCERGLQLCEECAATRDGLPVRVRTVHVRQLPRPQQRGDLAGDAVRLARRAAADSNPSGSSGIGCWARRSSPRATPAAAKTALERSLALYVAERDAAATHMYGQNTEVHTKSLLSLTHLCLGDVDAALEAGLDALRTADAVRHPHSTAIPMVYVGGWVFGLCGAAEQMMTVGEKPARAGRAASTVWISRACGRFHRMGALPARQVRSRGFP